MLATDPAGARGAAADGDGAAGGADHCRTGGAHGGRGGVDARAFLDADSLTRHETAVNRPGVRRP